MGWPRTTESFPEPTTWNGGEPDPDPRPDEPTSAMERLGVPSLAYVLEQYRSDVLHASTLDREQVARRIAMIDAALADFGEDR